VTSIPTGARIDIEDFIARIEPESADDRPGVWITDGGRTTGKLARVSVFDAPQTAIVFPADAELTIEDVHVRHAGQTGVEMTALDRIDTCIFMNRVLLEDVGYWGIRSQAYTHLVASHLHIRRADPERGVGLELLQSAGFELTDFLFEGPGAIGISIEGGFGYPIPMTTCELRNEFMRIKKGKVSGFGVGFSIGRAEVEPEDAMNGVTYSGNTSAFRRR
jgi:hypothetical protein